MIPLLLTLLTLTVNPDNTVIVDTCDVIELNHLHSNSGTLVLSQWIFWDWSHSRKRFVVKSWRMANKHSPQISKTKLRFTDHELSREVRAVEFRETFTTYDPEVYDREFHPREYRQGLSPKFYPILKE